MSAKVASRLYSFLITPFLIVFLAPRAPAQILTQGTQVESPQQGTGEQGGCTLTSAAAVEMAPQIVNPQSVMRPDQIVAMMSILYGLDQLLQVNPQFVIYNDAASPNAFATPAMLDPQHRDGTVMFGYRLLGSEVQQTGYANFTVSAIMAHEFGHILQFKYGENLPTKQKELEADYIAGWYIGNTDVQVPALAISQALQSFYQKGGYDFNSPNHHGTPEERVEAVEAGIQGSSSSLPQMFHDAHEFVLTKIEP